ncbi:hypothetical protein M2451_001649 [Dysgonomonas sp. PFB1-18]|uniref:DUF4623 domain-containing protein n=1 Tax=unclassified Dysgonomonas TaxID=2630389 RepID=UPI00247305D3|nr:MULTISPECIES: DUF4623 domain-containing protein [unclassified Dysgonomonas]MDL2303504.1 DUF4623 domain-containing protein [Dysgonomonas sp. OttesenSCG-928-D17]MDH6308893.1 hypothetical protein [Dysgonomonas sp. PF1-14]MDH6338644.1 hypothetical protein [Dysgonomonas sp. PF1-16]MDH6380328.1 hypothetical protein [Dysgonomonas sp. PFB1-18]MDH6397658.1 hypothetical protein [Dysgonomonas sp. PF1-23]
MKNFNFKIVGLALLFTILFACNDNFEPRYERLTTISDLIIANGGIDGKTAIRGTYVPEENMFVFDNVPAETDLQNIRFTGSIALGAAPEFETYDFFATNPQEIKIINREVSGTYKVKFNILSPAMDPAINRVVVTLEDGVTEVIGEVDKENKILYLDAKNGEYVFLKSIEMLPKHALYEFTALQGSKIYQDNPGTIKLDHMGRTDEYAIEFIYIPPVGADFDNKIIHDFTSGANKFPNYGGATTRGQGSIDADRVVIPLVDRIEYVPLASLLAGNLSGKAVSKTYSGTYEITNAFAFNGYYYSTPLLAWGSGYHVRCWTDLSADPVVTGRFDITSRYGDGSTMQLDENGNGYVFSYKNDFTYLLRGEVTNYTTIGNHTLVPISNISPIDGQLGHMYLNAVRDHSVYGGVGNLNEYTVVQAGKLSMRNRDMNELFFMPLGGAIPAASLYACVFYYNNARYLGIVSGSRSANPPIGISVDIYDITNGDSTQQALEIFKANPSGPIFSHNMGVYSHDGVATYGATLATTTNRTGDKLYIMAIAGNSGIIIIELPKKVDD